MALRLKILLLCILLAGMAAGQQLAVKWGDAYKNRKNSYITKIIGEGKDSYYALRYSGGYIFSYIPHVWIDKYSAFGLQQEFSTEIEIPTRNGEAVEVEDIYNLKGTMLLLSTYLNYDAGKKSIYAYTVDTTAKIGKNYREVDFIPLQTRRDDRNEHIALATDSSGLMLFHTEYDLSTGNEKLVCRLVDNNLKEQFYKTIDIPYKQDRVQILSGVGDSRGGFYIMLRIADLREGLFVKEARSYAYLLLAIGADGNVREYDMDLGGPQVSEVMLKRTPAGNILVAGFFTNKNNTNGGIAGTFYINIDGATGKVLKRGFKEFDKSFLELFLNNKKINKGEELSRYQLNDLIIQPDNSVILIAEQTFEDLICFYDGRTGIQTCNNHYYYNDIIVASLTAEGDVKWMRKIPKQQETVNDGGIFSSYLLMQHKGKLYLVFNDNVRNFEYTPSNIGIVPATNQPGMYDPYNMTSPQKSQVALVEIDSAGTVTKKPFFSAKDNKIIIRPRLSYQPNEDIVIIYGEYGVHYRLGKLIFKDAEAIEEK